MPSTSCLVPGEAWLFLADWLTRDPARPGASLASFAGHPAYGTAQLRNDLDRFNFLLRGSDGEPSASHRSKTPRPASAPARAAQGMPSGHRQSTIDTMHAPDLVSCQTVSGWPCTSSCVDRPWILTPVGRR